MKLKLTLLKLVVSVSMGVISTTSAETYVIENGHTYATFKIMHQGKGMQPGVFKDVEGTLQIDKEGEIKKINVSIDVNSIETWHDARDAHLKSPDYFNVKRYPKMKFKSRKVTKLSNEKYEIDGDITLHGVKKRIKATGTRGSIGKDPFGGHRTGGNVYFTINRRDFGMTHMPNEIVGDKVEVDFFWEALEKSTVEAYQTGLQKALSGGK